MRISLPTFTIFLILVLLPSLALAKAPTKKEIDRTLLGLSKGKLAEVTDSEDHLHEMKIDQENREKDLAIAKLNLQAAKAWVDASQAVSVALELSTKAAEADSQTEETEDYAARVVRARRTSEWRDARWQAARSAVALQQTRITLARSEVSHAAIQVDLARLGIYDKTIGGDADVEVEMGKAQVKLGRVATQMGKDRRKAEEAQRAYDDLVARAAELDPSI